MYVNVCHKIMVTDNLFVHWASFLSVHFRDMQIQVIICTNNLYEKKYTYFEKSNGELTPSHWR